MSYKCNACGDTFPTNAKLLQHVADAHPKRSKAALKAELSRRVYKPPIVSISGESGLTGEPWHVVIDPKDFGKIHVEGKAYQRWRLTPWVNQLIYVLATGGEIIDEVCIAQRPNEAWYMVDGAQRFYAHMDVGVPMRAMIVPTDGKIETEQRLFHILNARRAVNANTKVKSWFGKLGVFLRDLEEKDGSPYFKHINFTADSHRTYPAAVFVRGITAAMSGTKSDSATDQLLVQAETLFVTDAGRERANMFVEVLPAVFPSSLSPMRIAPAIGFGRVCYRRWQDAELVFRPPAAALMRIQKMKWDEVTRGTTLKFLSTVEEHIESRWPLNKHGK